MNLLELGVIATQQPSAATEYRSMVESRLGPELECAACAFEFITTLGWLDAQDFMARTYMFRGALFAGQLCPQCSRPMVIYEHA